MWSLTKIKVRSERSDEPYYLKDGWFYLDEKLNCWVYDESACDRMMEKL